MNSLSERALSRSVEAGTAYHLDSLALIDVSGEDAESFLQGQFSNDVATIGQWQCQLNAYCNPKGRALAVIRLIRHPGGFRMIVPVGVADGLVKRLRMYVLRARVSIDPNAETEMAALIGGESENSGDQIQRVAVRGIVQRNLLFGPKSALNSVIQSAPNPGNHDSWWRLIDIQSGIAQVYPQTVELFIPQMINLDLVDGVSFSKGCYPGQEIVARLRYLGKLKQRMLVGTVQGLESILPGDSIYSDQRPDQKSGQVVDAVRIDQQTHMLSAVVPSSLIEQGDLSVGSSAGPALQRVALPYPIPADQPR